jgi:hypothetical protein
VTLLMEMHGIPVKRGAWLYGGSVRCPVLIVRRDTWYGTGDYEDEPDVSNDAERETFEVLYGLADDPRFAGGGQYASLAEAIAAARRACDASLTWEPDRYASRTDFEQAPDPAALCNVLSAQILNRLSESPDPAREAQAIAADLRSAGHALWSWDEADDFSIWGDDYAKPPSSTRFLLEMRWPSDEDPAGQPTVKVSFGPWPTAG